MVASAGRRVSVSPLWRAPPPFTHSWFNDPDAAPRTTPSTPEVEAAKARLKSRRGSQTEASTTPPRFENAGLNLQIFRCLVWGEQPNSRRWCASVPGSGDSSELKPWRVSGRLRLRLARGCH